MYLSDQKGGFLNLWRAKIPVGAGRVVLDGTCLVMLEGELIARNEVSFDPTPRHEAICVRKKGRASPFTS